MISKNIFSPLLLGIFVCLSSLQAVSQTSASKKAPTASPVASKDAVLAQVGDSQILLSEFNLLYGRIAQSAVNPPTKTQFLEDLIRMEAGVQEARKSGQDKDPRIQQAIKQAIYSGFLELNLGEKIQNIPKATPKDLEEFYKRNPEIRFSFILVDVKPGANPNEKALARKRGEEILAEVRSSKRPFRELVKLYSDDPLSKARDGDAGWHRRSTLLPGYYDKLIKMKTGEISELMETPNGFHIVQLVDRRSFDAASIAATRIEWFEEQKVKIGRQFTDQLRSRFKVQINQDLLK